MILVATVLKFNTISIRGKPKVNFTDDCLDIYI